MKGENGGAGARRVYAVLFPGENAEEGVALLKAKYRTYYELSPDLYLVKTADLSDRIAESVGVTKDSSSVDVVVFGLNMSYSGFYLRSLWEWLGD